MGRPQTDEPLSLAEILDVIRAEAEDDGKLTVDDLLDAFGERAHGPLLFAPALIAVAPIIGALPAVSITMALLMTLFSAQLLLGLRRPWAPKVLCKLSLPGNAVVRALTIMAPGARVLGRLFKPRLRFLARGPWARLTGAMALCVALLSCLGALVPGLIVPPALAMMVIALGMATQDGLALLVSYGLTGGVGALVFWIAERVGVF